MTEPFIKRLGLEAELQVNVSFYTQLCVRLTVYGYVCVASECDSNLKGKARVTEYSHLCTICVNKNKITVLTVCIDCIDRVILGV